ncbi:MAG: hypothetical protein Q8K70_09930 [Bacteroidota bacterium]|nr:hypothetical protein [Bacteroidota bacterium]
MNKNQNDNQNPQTGNLSNQQNKNVSSSTNKSEVSPTNNNETHPTNKNHEIHPNDLYKTDEKGFNEKQISTVDTKNDKITNHSNETEKKDEKYGYPSEEDTKKRENQKVEAGIEKNTHSFSENNSKNTVNPKG